jgi:acyl carrier protein
MDTMQKVKEIISRQTDIDEEKLSDNTTLEDIVADSLDIVEMLMEIEEAFDIDIPDEDAEKLSTVGELCNYIDIKLSE